MRREDLEFIERRDISFDEYESDYKCPKCKDGIITRWKETTIGYKCSGWYNCSKCGYDPEPEMRS